MMNVNVQQLHSISCRCFHQKRHKPNVMVFSFASKTHWANDKTDFPD